MADSRRWSPESSSKRKKEYKRTVHDEPRGMRSSAESLSSSSSSTSSSYIDISRTFPNRSGIRAFFTAPSERRRLRKRRSSRLLKLNNSSSSSINSDLAYGTGFIKRPKSRGVRSRKGKEIDRERHRDFNRERETISQPREKERSLVSRATTDAEILAVGAGLAKLARDQNKQDLKGLRNGHRSEVFAVKQSLSGYGNEASRGLGSSKVTHGTGKVDDDGWESASDAGSESSVDSKLAFGGDPKGGWFGWGRAQHKPQSRKSSIVDPRLFGPANSLNGIVTEPVGFGDVSWSSTSDFGQRSSVAPGPNESIAGGSQSSLQRVYPIPTSDPSRFEAARSSVVSGADPYISSRPAPIPLQQPQPIAPVSQSVYEPSYSTRGEPSVLPNTSTPSGRSKSLAEAAIIGVAGAAVGAVIASDRQDDRKDKRRDDRDIQDEDRSSKRRDNARKADRDVQRKERRGDSPDHDDRKQRRREKDRQKDSADDQRRDKKRERHRDEGRDDGRDERREQRREERRNERSDDRYENRRTKSENSVSTTSVDPFQYQVEDDAFSTPIAATPVIHSRMASGPTVVTVEREPNFARKRSSSIKDQSVISNSNPRRDDSVWDEREQRYITRDSRDRSLHDAESIYQETEHSTAPIEVAAIGAAVAAVNAEDYRESRSDRRRDERRGERREYDDYDSSARKRKSSRERKPERDPIQEEADRAYREIVMARKIASQVIRSRTPSPDRSVVDKYDNSQENEIIRIVTPPGMEDHKKEGPYDAPNADFKLDLVMEDPRELQVFSIPSISLEGSNRGVPYLKRDPDASQPRPHLNLVRPTPTPSPMPEEQAARAETSSPSKPKGQGTSPSSDVVIDNKGNVVSSPVSPVSKGVTWGENETKHYEVESPQEHRDEFVSKSEIQARDKSEQKPVEKSVEKPKSSNGSKRGGWGAIAAGIIGVGAATTNSNETSKTPIMKENGSPRSEKRQETPFEYRGVVVEPDSAPRRKDTRSPPSTGPKPSVTQSSRVPGAFDDDLDFTATVAAGLQDTGFDPNIVINDPSFRRRDSPLGSNQPGIYRAPFAETVSDLGSVPAISSGLEREPHGSVIEGVIDPLKELRRGSPENDEFSTILSKKEQKKREKAARRQSGDDVLPPDQEPISKGAIDESESVFETKLSKKEQKKRDKAAQKQAFQTEDVTPTITPSVAEEIVEEPESYFENPKKSKSKKSKKLSAFDEFADDTPQNDRKVSVPVNAFDDLRNGEDEWNEPKKSKKKSKRDSERFDSPSRSSPPEIVPELEITPSKKSKDKSRRKSEQYDPEADPTEVSLPPSTPSETSRDGELDESRKSRKPSKRDSAERDDSRSVVSADASRYIDDDNRKSKKKSRSSTKDDFDDTRSVASAPAGDDFEDAKKSKKKDKRNSGGFFGLFGSKSESGTRDESPKDSKDDFEETKKKSKKSKRNSVPDGLGFYGDTGSQSISDLARVASNGNGHSNGSHIYDEDGNDGPRSDNDKTRSQAREGSPSAKKDSFLAKAGTLGAGVGLAGAAVAFATQQHQQSKADEANSSQLPKQPLSGNTDASQSHHHEIYDPEITQRQFRPSIDPQYGDLLPLPPSDPASPNLESVEDLPGLPDSRPDTPDVERLSRDKSLSSVRKILQDAPVKLPSQSAVPLKFVMGNRSTPSSPGLVRSSPMQSPATPREDSLGFPRHRPRPTSWDSTKEYKPLYLVESNRRGSTVQQQDVEQNLPSLPPSESTSRTPSQTDFSDFGGGDAAEQLILNEQSAAEKTLFLDTGFKSPDSRQDLLDSQQSTPKADGEVFNVRNSPISLNSAEPPSLPVLPGSRSLSLRPESPVRSHEVDESESKALAEPALVSSIGYLASSLDHQETKELWLEELPSHSSPQRQPSPVDPMTKDRSSYLLQSSPLSKKHEDGNRTDDQLESSAARHASTYSDGKGLHSIEEREGIDIFGQSTLSESERSCAAMVGEPPPGKSDNSPSKGEASHDFTDTVASEEIRPEDDQKSAFRGIDDALRPTGEEAVGRSKKDRKKDKKKGKSLSRTSTMDEMPSLTVAQEFPSVVSMSGDTDSSDKSSSKQSKENKQSKELSRSSTQDDTSIPILLQQIARKKSDPEEIKFVDDTIATKSKKDKKKVKKNAISALDQDFQDDKVTAMPQESLSAMSDEAAADSAYSPDLWTVENKKSKNGKKKGRVGVSPKKSVEMDLSREIPDVADKAHLPTNSSLTSKITGDTSIPRMHPKDVSVRESGLLPDNIANTYEDSMILPEHPALAAEESRELLEERHPVEVSNPAMNESSQEGEGIPVQGSDTEDLLNPTRDSRDLSTAEHLPAETKKGKKKKKGKVGLSWEPHEEAPGSMQPFASQEPDEFEIPGSKKSKKKSKKAQSSVSEEMFSESIPESSNSVRQPNFPDLKTDLVPGETLPEGLSKSSLRDVISPLQHSEVISPVAALSEATSAPNKTEITEVLGESLNLTETNDLASSPPNKNPQKPPFFADSTQATIKSLPMNSAEEPPNSDSQAVAQNLSTEKATPVGGPGAWPVTPITPWASTGAVLPGPPSGGYFPSAAGLHSPKSHRESEALTKGGYFPSATALLPVVGDVALGANSMERGAGGLEEPAISYVESQAVPTTPDGLKSGYAHEQLSLARQLQEEFGLGGKKSKKEKKKRQSLPSTPDSDVPRSRGVESPSQIQPRARSLSIGPTAVAERLDDEQISAQREMVYSEDQFELARQLEAESELGNKKGKKDKKKRPGLLSRSSTQDVAVSDQAIEEPPPIDSQTSSFLNEADLVVSPPKGDGFAAGYQEDQLSLARQLQAEFGAKKSKKEKKRRSSSQIPMQSAEMPEDSFEEITQSTGPELSSTNEVNIRSIANPNENESLRDGLETGYSEDQLELARQLKDEFGSNAKKSKKDKKRKSLIRGASDQFLDTAQAAAEGPEQPEFSRGANINDSEVVESSSEQPLPVPEDGYETTKLKSKEDKKRKKRGSMVPDNGDKSVPLMSIDESKDKQVDDVEQNTVDIIGPTLDNQSAASTIKPREDRNQDNLLALKEKGFAPENFGAEVEALHNSPEVSADLTTIPDEAYDARENDTPMSRKNSKKSKKKAQRNISHSESFDIPKVETEYDPVAIKEGGVDTDPTVGGVKDPLPSEPTGDFIYSIKKSKKDKKKQKIPIEPPIATLVEQTGDMEVARTDTISSPGKNTAPVLISPDDQESGDDFQFKESKTAKKKRQSTPASASENTPTSVVEPTAAQFYSDQQQDEVPDHNHHGVSSMAEVAPDEMFGGYTLTSKKSKKERKIRKGSSIAGSEELSSIATPTDLRFDPGEPKETMRTFVDTDERAIAGSVPQPNLPHNLTFVESTIDKSVEDPVDEWAFTVKKSKKDKTKRKSALSTPVEPAVLSSVLSESSIAPHISTDQILPVSQASNDFNGKGAAPEPLEFVTKISKKEKKKRKSGLSTPLEGVLPVEQANVSFGREALSEHLIGTERAVFESATQDTSKAPITRSQSGPIVPQNEQPFNIKDLVTSPALLEKEVLVENPVPENILTSSLETSEGDRMDLDEEVSLDGQNQKQSKKDKRKRQTTDIPSNSEAVSAEPHLTSWADQVEEAEVERSLPVIEDIDKNESLAHIPSSIEAGYVDDFVRPVKKGKKGKKEDTGSIATSSKKDSFGSSIGADASKNKANEKNFSDPILSATGALIGTTVLAETANASKPANIFPIHPPIRKLSKKEKRKKSVDQRSAQREDLFDDPVLWEGEKSKVFEEPVGVDDGNGSDGFWATQKDHDEQIPPIGSPNSLQEPRTTDKIPVVTDEQVTHEDPTSNTTTSFRQDPEQFDKNVKQDDVENLHSSAPLGKDIPDESSIQSQHAPIPVEQWNDLPDDIVVTSSNKAKKKSKQSRLSAWDLHQQHKQERDVEPSTTANQSLPEPPRNFVEKSPRAEGIYRDEDQTPSGKAPKPAGKSFSESSYNGKDISLQEISAYEDDQVTHLGTKSYTHPGSSSLPAVREESPGLVDFEPPAAPFSHAQATDDTNRDSAFVTESPIPRQRSFADSENVRDSGVHLRDFSPAPISATDDAIARMSWPTVDEETETVDLHRSQKLKKEESPKYYGKSFTEVPIPQGDQQKQMGANWQTKEIESERAISHHVDGGENHPAPSTQRDRVDAHRDVVGGSRSLQSHESQYETKNWLRNPDNKASDSHNERHHGKSTNLHQKPAEYGSQKAQDLDSVRQKVERIESPDSFQRTKDEKYGSLNSSEKPTAEKPAKLRDSSIAAGVVTALAGASVGFGAGRQSSREHRPGSVGSNRSTSNINRLRTPDPKYRSESIGSSRSSGTPPLRRSDRKSGDLRSLSQHSQDLAKEAELAAITAFASNNVAGANTNPTANEGRVRAKDMADVYDGFGEGRMGSPRSPTRPHSMRRRQSMQVLDLESRLEQLASENRMLADAKAQAERTLQSTQQNSSTLVERDAEIDSLKRTLDWLQNEVTRLTEINDGLTSANITLGNQHNDRYGSLESQHAQATRELQEIRDSHNNISADMEGLVKNEVQTAVQEKDRDIAQLRAELEAAKDQIREMQRQILSSKANDSEFLTVRDEDYFDTACQKLCQHIQQWVLRFSKFSDMRACRFTNEINNDKIIDRLDNAILDGSDVDSYLADRVKRRDVFMSMTMTMVWEFVFTRYLFGMDREQRQKLKSLEKLLSEVGPAAAVHQWRATTLTLLSKRAAFIQQREQDTLAVVNAVLETLTEILPPPSHLEDQIQEQLVRVMKAAVDLSIEMRTQRAEYMMLPPLQPEYDANGDLASKVSFNAALMNERSGDTVSNEQLEEDSAVVRIVLFPLVVKKGNDSGEGDEEIVVCPAQVLVAKPKKSVRVFSPESMAHQNHSRVSMQSMQSSMPADYGDSSVI